MNEHRSLLASLQVFEKFGEYFVTGLRPRIEHEVSTRAPAITTSTRAQFAGALAGGAIMGRTRPNAQRW